MKKIYGILIALVLVVLCSCSFFTDVASIEFGNAPEASYEQDVKVDAEDFTIEATLSDGTSKTIALTSDELTVQGIVNGKLDTSTVGTHTLKVSYNGVTITFTYNVTGSTQSVDSWANHKAAAVVYSIGSAEELAKLADNTSWPINVVLTADIDLGKYVWQPFEFYGTFDGQGHKISNLRVNSHVTTADGSGLFSKINGESTVKNLTLESFSIDAVKDIDGNYQTNIEYAKNIGAVAGTTYAKLTINNVNVFGFVASSVGRCGALVGQSNKEKLIISNCYCESQINGYNFLSAATDDGDGDKLGGLVGQVQAGVTISNCQIKTVIAGTRDLGGICGYIAGDSEISGCVVLPGTVISASVEGGMVYGKGARNIGGVVGTISSTQLSLSDITISGDAIFVSNSLYEYSRVGKYVGGLRLNTASTASTSTVSAYSIKYGDTTLASITEAKDFGYKVSAETINVFTSWVDEQLKNVK